MNLNAIVKVFVYLAAILDRYSRRVIGWAISKRIDAELCVAALQVALAGRKPPAGCIHHSDRGVQYACREYVALLEQANMKISMSRTGNQSDNAHIESFFKTLSTRKCMCRTTRTSRMSPDGFPISSRRCTTTKDYIRLWGTSRRNNTRHNEPGILGAF